MMNKRLLEYYKTVQGYHQIAEESHENVMVSADLLHRYVDLDGLCIDIAGGTGHNAEFLDIPRQNYVCVDVSMAGLRIAREKRRGSTVLMDVTNLGLKSGIASTVLCSYSLEHLSNPEKALEEMIRISKHRGRIVIWSPNWDNIFRINFPQFAHKPRSFVERVRWKIFLKMLQNEFFPFRYNPFIHMDVAALAEPDRYLSWDSDAVHCVLCQETYKWFKKKKLRIIHVSDFGEVPSTIRNDFLTRVARRILKPLLPVLRYVPLVRWFVIRFPIVVEKPLLKNWR